MSIAEEGRCVVERTVFPIVGLAGQRDAAVYTIKSVLEAVERLRMRGELFGGLYERAEDHPRIVVYEGLSEAVAAAD